MPSGDRRAGAARAVRALGGLAAAAVLVACQGQAQRPLQAGVRVFADRGARQCESGGISAGASAAALAEAGVDVLASYCALRTGMAFAAVCGGPTADIVVHEIDPADRAAARHLGFTDVAALRGADAGYVLVDCGTRTPL